MYIHIFTYVHVFIFGPHTNNSVAESAKNHRQTLRRQCRKIQFQQPNLHVPQTTKNTFVCFTTNRPICIVSNSLQYMHQFCRPHPDLFIPKLGTMKLQYFTELQEKPDFCELSLLAACSVHLNFSPNHSRSNSEISQIHLNNLNSDLAPNIEH
ncbi:Hypothetical_protein [Hexamita inflata]|uniref:Hypothetical_protein n=1 Tax=Hexamita inflata TaxID=28002 RepID=A0ABP1HUL2_9EUKA